MRLTEEEFSRERRYQITMTFIRKMLEDGLISEEEYCLIETMKREKLRPVFGNLLSGNFLLCAAKRANMADEKEANKREDCNED